MDLLTCLTPDSSRQELLSLERFCDEAGEHQLATLQIRRGGLSADIGVRGGVVGRRIAKLRPKLRATRAEILFRLDRDTEARAEAERLLAACPGCAEAGRRAALVFAKTLDFQRAESALTELAGMLRGEARLLAALESVRQARRFIELAGQSQGAQAIHARAMAYATLGAYGRAYRVLSPHEPELLAAPEDSVGYAKIAWLAGYPETSERVLSRHLPRERVLELTRSWPGWTKP